METLLVISARRNNRLTHAFTDNDKIRAGSDLSFLVSSAIFHDMEEDETNA